MRGLILSVVGDACQVYPTFFGIGVVAFGLAHCFYIKAFGFQPLDILDVIFGIVLYSSMGAYLGHAVIPRLPDVLSMIGVPIYCTLLTTTAWRALARALGSPGPFKSRYFTIRGEYLAAIGSILFAISACFVLYSHYVQPLQAQQFLTMSTYYAAQFLITLSANQAISEPTKVYW